jgi:hypothetical protein
MNQINLAGIDRGIGIAPTRVIVLIPKLQSSTYCEKAVGFFI